MKRFKQTFTGTPVQFMKWSESTKRWQVLPGVISSVHFQEVSITVIGDKRNQIFVNVRHADFRKKGFDYWNFIPKKEGGQLHNVVFP